MHEEARLVRIVVQNRVGPTGFHGLIKATTVDKVDRNRDADFLITPDAEPTIEAHPQEEDPEGNHVLDPEAT